MKTDKNSERKLRKTYRKRRRHHDHILGTPLRRRLAKKVEKMGKVLFVGTLGRLIAPRKATSPLDPHTIHNILIIRNDAIGDMVLTTPFWRILKSKHPTIRIGVVGSFRNLPIISSDPDVDYRYDCSAVTLKHVLMTARETRKQKWDVVLPMIYNKKTKMALLSKLFAPSALSSMVLAERDPRERYEKLFSICIPTALREGRDPIMKFMRRHFEETFAISVTDAEWRPSLIVPDVIVGHISSQIDTYLQNDGTKGYIHVNLEAKTNFKEFGYSNSLTLCKLLIERYPDYSIIWTTSTVNTRQAEEFLLKNPVAHLHLQRTQSIFELIAVVRGADVVISPDTSVIHIASAEQRPVVGLYPFEHGWPPHMVPHVVLIPTLGEPVSTIPIEDVIRVATQLMPSQSTENSVENQNYSENH